MLRKLSILILSIFCLCLLLLVVGCSRKVMPSTTIVVKDSVIEKTVEKIVHLKGDTILIEKKIECDPKTLQAKPFEEKISRGIQRLDVKVDQGKLTVQTDCDSLLKIQNTIIQKMHSESEKEVKPVIIHEAYWYDKYIARPLAFLFLLVAAFVAGKIYLKTINPSTLLKS
jgi:hypothetical protein